MVLLPEENEKDLENGEQFPAEVFEDLEIVFVTSMDEVLERALLPGS
jgi:ATP-dependent Lon protease